ncbi:Bifunctional protein: zinc-containing alcohol dehydrogenase; quinone oxidoreductase (NADPH:quinone reductase); Similar to arginate lyase [hydrothermal vent metagenome]|uniref:Bifunctional protein: zinc-containing alcohol dehydrogenase quinone oxidoreductase ( NADPH:quinone reductase) Similar to arginate lyase n=1 Tax=hydrothermal vent metagenome TaxID=652676 RepID=A0A3B1C882_9ZZZZ
MKAVGYQHALPITDVNALLDIELPRPLVTGKDVLVRVEAVSVNPVDTKIRARDNPSEGTFEILGWDATGVVESVGSEVRQFSPGDKVWYAGAIDRPGTNMEYHLVDERIIAKMPSSLNYAEAAALPLTAITAWELLFDRLKITKKQKGTLLIIGAAGGVGSIMIQLAKELTNLTIIATASRPETREWVLSLGADDVLDHNQSLVSQLQDSGYNDVIYVASLTHTAAHLSEIASLISPQGDLAVIDDPKTFDIMPFKTKSIAIHWELMFTRSLFKTQDMVEQHHLLTQVADLVDQGRIKTTMIKNFGTINAKNLIKAHALLESGKSIGKIVLAGYDR